MAEANSLDERILDVQKHAIPFVLGMILPMIVVYFAFVPQNAAIILVDYFKLEPGAVFLIYQNAMPVLLAIALARMLTIITNGAIWILKVMLLIPVSVILLSLKCYAFINKQKAESVSCVIVDFLWGNPMKGRADDGKSLLKSNIVLALIFFVIIFISRLIPGIPFYYLWEPSRNNRLKIDTNLHYYCQITGGYNETSCLDWKAKRDEEQKHLIRKEFWNNYLRNLWTQNSKPISPNLQSSQSS